MKEEKGIKENQVKVTYNSQISLAIIEAKWKMSFEVCSASSSFIANDLGEPGFARYIFKNPLQSPSLFYLSPMKFPCTRSPLSCRNFWTSWVQWNMKLAIGTVIVVVWCFNFKNKLEPLRVVAFCSSITTHVCVLEVGPPKPLGCLNEFQCILASLICYFHFMCRSISEKKSKDFFVSVLEKWTSCSIENSSGACPAPFMSDKFNVKVGSAHSWTMIKYSASQREVRL